MYVYVTENNIIGQVIKVNYVFLYGLQMAVYIVSVIRRKTLDWGFGTPFCIYENKIIEGSLVYPVKGTAGINNTLNVLKVLPNYFIYVSLYPVQIHLLILINKKKKKWMACVPLICCVYLSVLSLKINKF